MQKSTFGLLLILLVLILSALFSCNDANKKSGNRTVKIPQNETDQISTVDGGNLSENNALLRSVNSGNDFVVRAKVISDGSITYIKLNSLEVQILRPRDTVFFDSKTHKLNDTAVYRQKAVLFSQAE